MEIDRKEEQEVKSNGNFVPLDKELCIDLLRQIKIDAHKLGRKIFRVTEREWESMHQHRLIDRHGLVEGINLTLIKDKTLNKGFVAH